jgi:hypothetical protein
MNKKLLSILLFLFALSSCTNEQAYEMIRPYNTKKVGETQHCYNQESLTIFVGNVMVHIPGGIRCETIDINICAPMEEVLK